jgi:hypothetical protein
MPELMVALIPIASDDQGVVLGLELLYQRFYVVEEGFAGMQIPSLEVESAPLLMPCCVSNLVGGRGAYLIY